MIVFNAALLNRNQTVATALVLMYNNTIYTAETVLNCHSLFNSSPPCTNLRTIT